MFPYATLCQSSTGETIQIKAKKFVKCRVAKAEKDAILGSM